MDESSTVESVLAESLQAATYFKKEPETETFWLFRQQNAIDDETGKEKNAKTANQEFDYPLPKEKKILKLMYVIEREDRNADQKDKGSGSPSKEF